MREGARERRRADVYRARLCRPCGHDHFSEYACGKEGPWEDICSRFLEGWRLAKETAESAGSGFQVYLGMEIRFPHDENDFLVYGMTEEFFQKYPWIYEKELPDLYQIAEKEGMTIIQAHPFRSVCFPADPECLHGIEIFNGNPRHDSHNDLARRWQNRQGFPVLQARISIRCRIWPAAA